MVIKICRRNLSLLGTLAQESESVRGVFDTDFLQALNKNAFFIRILRPAWIIGSLDAPLPWLMGCVVPVGAPSCRRISKHASWEFSQSECLLGLPDP